MSVSPGDPKPASLRRVVLLSGMSGAGLSTALKAFEDLGYEAVDNLRLTHVPALVADEPSSASRPLAISIDTRNADFSVDALLKMRKQLAEASGRDVRLTFLECSDDTLQQRFTETRRRHPLAMDRPVTDGIRHEREVLRRIREAAEHVIDTSDLSIHNLRRIIIGHYRLDTALGLSLFITSFAYRHGVPREADLMFDVRFLANPHWDPALRPLTGQDPAVAAHVQRDPDYRPFLDHLEALLVPLLPRYGQEGKSYLTIAIGCTGGRHRSVVVAEHLATTLAGHGYVVGVGHRDLEN